jgi:hypothetical protein
VTGTFLLLAATAAGTAAGLALLAWRRAASNAAADTRASAAAQAAYAADPAARATCEHLRPIEDEAREQGVDCRLEAQAPAAIFIRALDPGPEAMAPLRLAACVRHEESRVVGPHSWSDPAYRCTRCGCAIAFHQGGFGNDPPPLRIRQPLGG